MNDTTDNKPSHDTTGDGNGDLSDVTAAELAHLDLNGDGKIGAAERFVANVGVVDAWLEERAEEGGVGGTVAGLLHKIVDRVDND